MIRTLVVAAVAGALVGSAAGGQPAQTVGLGPFMVFFDWGKPELRRDDAERLDKVAEAYRSSPGKRVTLNGHTDRSGRAAANRTAGLRRAETVRSELEKRGIPRNAMILASFGEDRPLVPTDDGVREVQNRRVEIAFEE